MLHGVYVCVRKMIGLCSGTYLCECTDMRATESVVLFFIDTRPNIRRLCVYVCVCSSDLIFHFSFND